MTKDKLAELKAEMETPETEEAELSAEVTEEETIEEEELTAEEASEDTEEEPVEELSAEEEPVKILVVDDDEAFREFVHDALEEFQGYELREAGDGLQGAMLIGSWRPDLLILDIRMPNMNGTELLKLIRQDEANSGMRVIIASAHLSPELKGELEALSADILLDKPVRLAKLVAAIQKMADLNLA